MISTVVAMGFIPVNTYFYIDDESNSGFLIDPGAESGRLLNYIKERGFKLERILLTHGHFDHIGAVEEIRKELDIPVCMQEKGRIYAENPDWNLSSQTGRSLKLENVTYLADGSEIVLDANPGFSLKLISVPGHTLDGATYYSKTDAVAFVGDSVFRESFGRTDLPGGDETTLLRNIAKGILSLPLDTVLLSGHSEPTTVKEERQRPWYAPYITN